MGRKYWNCTGTDGLLSLRGSMATGLGEERCVGMGIRLARSPGYSGWMRGDVWAMGCGTTLATGMAEVVTAVAWEEWEGIVMVTIVLLVICVCGTEPVEVVEGTVLVARIGATVAAGVTVLKMGFCVTVCGGCAF